VQVRYNSKPVAASVEWSGGTEGAPYGRIRLDEAVYGIASGQSAVLYQDEVVVAGGVIIASGA
jgi:tRNA U34 2-thiouridine synthase MnmA/TrmU